MVREKEILRLIHDNIILTIVPDKAFDRARTVRKVKEMEIRVMVMTEMKEMWVMVMGT